MFSHGTTVHTYLISHAVVRFEEPSVDLYLTEWGGVHGSSGGKCVWIKQSGGQPKALQ